MGNQHKEKALYFKLLGTPQVFSYGEELKIPRRAVRGLAYYLACQTELSNRGSLQNLLWPDDPPEKAPVSLRENLSKLRSTLPDREMLVSKGSYVHFDRDLVSSDVWEFLNLSQELEPILTNYPITSSLPQDLIPQITEAIDLWSGDRFLNTNRLPTSEVMEDWQRNFGALLKQKQESLILHLVNDLVSRNNMTEAFDYIDLLYQDQSQEYDLGVHYKLLSALVEAQQYTKAQNYLDHLRLILERIDIDLESTALDSIVEILENPVTQSAGEAEQKWLYTLSFQLPFSGHDAIFAQVQKLRDNRQGMLLTGKTGYGKSRLAYEIYHRLFRKHRFSHIEVAKTESRLPYAALKEIILKLIPFEELMKLPIPQRRKLTPLFNDLSPDLPTYRAPLALPPDEQLIELGNGITWLFTELAKKQPLLIVIDDFHYCDFASFRAIYDLVKKNFFLKKGFLILTANAELLSDSKKELLNQVSHQIQQINIPQLPMPQVGTILSQLLDRTTPSELLELLYRESDGNLHLLLDTASSFRQQSMDSEDINDLILKNALSLPGWYNERRERLTENAVEVLEAAAILSTPITHPLLEAAVNISSGEILDSLDELEQIGFIAPRSENFILDGYQFTHRLVKSRTIENMTLARKRGIHLAVIEAIETVFRHDMKVMSATLVEHALGAGEIKKAFEYTMRAADYAFSVFAPEDASLLYIQMENYMRGQLYHFSDTELLKFYVQWIHGCFQFNLMEQSKDHSEQLLKLGRARSSNHLSGAGLLYLARIETIAPLNGNNAMDLFDQALTLLEEIPPTLELLQVKVEKAFYYSAHGDSQIAYPLCNEIINTPNPDPDRRLEYLNLIDRTKFSMAYLHSQKGELKKADELLDEILDQFDKPYNAITELQYRNLQLWVKFYLGQSDNTEKALKQLVEDAKQFNNELITVELYTNLSRIYHHFGNNDKALEIAEMGIEIAERHNLYHLVTSFHIVKGLIYLSVGGSPKAQEEFELAMQAATKNNYQLPMNSAAIHLALVEGYDGDLQKGIRMTKAVLDAIQRSGSRFLYLQSVFYYYSLCINKDPQRQYHQIGRDEIEYYVAECKKLGLVLFQAYGEILLAYLEFNRGMNNRALEYVHRSINTSRSHGFLMYELSSYLLLATKKPLTEFQISRVNELIETNLNYNTHPQIKEFAEDYCQFIAKTIQND